MADVQIPGAAKAHPGIFRGHLRYSGSYELDVSKSLASFMRATKRSFHVNRTRTGGSDGDVEASSYGKSHH